MNAKHADKADSHSCPCCKFQSTTVANLKIHFMRIHCKDICKFTMNENCPQCATCEKTFNSKTAYYYHTTQCTPLTKSHTHYSAFLKIMA
jgi:hypothetical protein